MDLDTFKKKYKTKNTSNISKYKKEIFELTKDNFSQESICKFLQSNGVKTKQSNLSQYLKRHFKEPVKNISKVGNCESVKPIIQTQTTQQSSLFKKSEVKSYEIIEPDYSKFNP